MPRISALTSLTTADNSDELPIVDVSASVTKKITRGDLLKGPLPNNSVTTSAITDGSVTSTKLSTSAITLGYTEITTPIVNQSTTTTDVDIAGLSVTVNVPTGGRRVKITGKIGYNQTGGIGTVYSSLKIREGTTQLNSASMVPTIANVDVLGLATASFVPSAGSHTYKLSLSQNSTGPNFTVSAATTLPAYILVELI